MGKSNAVTDILNPKMLVKSLNPAELFSKRGWLGRKNIFAKLYDPFGLLFTDGNGDEKPKSPVDPAVVDETNAARERERRRASAGSSSTYTPRKSEALSASIGKRKLGGTY